MPSNFKKLVRARMAETGESWQPAARYIRGLVKPKGAPEVKQPVITDSHAIISEDGKYRYRLWRGFGGDLVRPLESTEPRDKRVVWVMLNPSTADAKEDDPTIRKCIGFSYRWGYGGIDVVNLYGFRATKPGDLWGDKVEPVGPHNDRWIMEALKCHWTGKVVVAWGAAGGRRADERKQGVAALIRFQGHTPMCLGVTREGDPRHPLMVSYKTELEVYG
jgi:hypothetical protein